MHIGNGDDDDDDNDNCGDDRDNETNYGRKDLVISCL